MRGDIKDKIEFLGKENLDLSQKSRVKAEKTKIFFQKASSGFGDVSFKERSGRFKA